MEDLVLIPDDGSETSHRILACHQVMANASPYFRAMLERNRFKEGTELQANGRVEVPLPETNGEALRIVCNIFHLQAHLVPKNPDLRTLSQIATLVDRYDCARTIQPWPSVWSDLRACNGYKFTDDPADKAYFTVTSLHVAGHLGYSSRFETASSQLIENFAFDENAGSKPLYSLDRLSQDLQDTILARRSHAIEKIIAILSDLQSQHEGGKSCLLTGSSNSFDCASLGLGNFILATREIFGSEWPIDKQWRHSIKLLAERVHAVTAKLRGGDHLKARMESSVNAPFGKSIFGNPAVSGNTPLTSQSTNPNNAAQPADPSSSINSSPFSTRPAISSTAPLRFDDWFMTHQQCSRQSEINSKVDLVIKEATLPLKLADLGNSFYRVKGKAGVPEIRTAPPVTK